MRSLFRGALPAAALLLGACVVSDANKRPDSATVTSTSTSTSSTTAAAPAGPAPSSTSDTAFGARGQPSSADSGVAASAASASTPAASGMRIEVDLAARQLYVYDGDKRVATHSVAVGSPQWPTQTGSWQIKQVIFNPEWIPPDESWAEERDPKKPGAPDNPLGRAQLVYDPPRTIHGTNQPSSIGKNVSHGSIRLPNEVIVPLARQVMAAGGAPKDDAWFRQAQARRTVKEVVDLPRPIPIRVY